MILDGYINLNRGSLWTTHLEQFIYCSLLIKRSNDTKKQIVEYFITAVHTLCFLRSTVQIRDRFRDFP